MKDPYERLVILLMEQEDDPMEDEERRRREADQKRFNDPKSRRAELQARAKELEKAIRDTIGGSGATTAREREELRKQLDQIRREINTNTDLGRGRGLGRLTRLKSAVVGGGTTYLGIIQNFLRKALGAGKSRISTNVLGSPA